MARRILYRVAEIIRLCRLFDFICKRESSHQFTETISTRENQANIVPIQFGIATIEFWSQGTWNRFLSGVNSSHSTRPKARHRDSGIAA